MSIRGILRRFSDGRAIVNDGEVESRFITKQSFEFLQPAITFDDREIDELRRRFIAALECLMTFRGKKCFE